MFHIDWSYWIPEALPWVVDLSLGVALGVGSMLLLMWIDTAVCERDLRKDPDFWLSGLWGWAVMGIPLCILAGIAWLVDEMVYENPTGHRVNLKTVLIGGLGGLGAGGAAVYLHSPRFRHDPTHFRRAAAQDSQRAKRADSPRRRPWQNRMAQLPCTLPVLPR